MKSKTLLVGLFVAFATVLSACGGGNDSSKTPSSPSASVPPVVSTPAPSVSTPKPSTPTPSVSTPAPSVSSPSVSTPTPSVSTPTPSISTSTPAPEVVLEKISVSGSYKVSYTVGETLDLTGAQLKLTYSDDSTDYIDLSVDMLGEYDMSTAGIKTITVTYEGLTTTLNIEVNAAEIEKVDPEVTFSIENGVEIKIGEAAPTFTVTEGLEYVTYYEDASNNNIGTTFPTEVGTYSIIVEVTGNDQYNDLRVWRWFKIVPNKLTPEISFSIESGVTLVIGKDAAPTVTVSDGLTYAVQYNLEGEFYSYELPTVPGTYAIFVTVEETETHNKATAFRWFYLVEDKLTPEVTFSIESGTTLVIGKDAAPTVTVTEGLEYTVQYDQAEAFFSNEFPTVPGKYAMVVKVSGNDQYNGTTKWVTFTLIEDTPVEKVDPEVTFSIENGATVTLGVDDWPTATVTEGLEYITYFEQNGVKLKTEYPTEAGTYSFIVEVTGNDQYNGVRLWRWFNVVEDKLTPEITFSIEKGSTLTLGVDPIPTVTVTEGLDYTVHYENETGYNSEVFPSTPGTYSMVVEVTGNDQYNSRKDWAVFHLVESGYSMKVNGASVGGMALNAEATDSSKDEYMMTLDLKKGDQVQIVEGGNAVNTWWENPSKNSDTYVATVDGSHTFYFKNYTKSGGGTSVWVSIPSDGNSETPTGEKIRVYFAKPSNWGSNINVYTWDSTGPTNGNWPGTKIQYDSVSGYYYVDDIATGTNIIFNDGSNQTADLVVPTNGNNLFSQSANAWSAYNA